jgi:CHASE1-domain containing sensor protein
VKIAAIWPMFLSRRRLFRPLPVALLLGSAALTGGLFYQALLQRERADSVAFAQLTTNAQADIQQRLITYTDALRSGASFLIASPSLSRGEWMTFAQTLDMPGRYPGINGIGVIYPVPSDRTEEFLARVRADGAPDFAIHPVPGAGAVPGREQFVVTEIAPESGNQPAVGVDVASERFRRLAAEAARDEGRPSATSRITLVQDEGKRPGFLLYVPVFRTACR